MKRREQGFFCNGLVMVFMVAGFFFADMPALKAQRFWGTTDVGVGAGVIAGTLKSNSPAVRDKSGGGFIVEFAFRHTDHLSTEITASQFYITADSIKSPYYPADNARCLQLNLGMTYGFLLIKDRHWTPWASCDLGLYMVDWDNWAYGLFGYGIAPGVGIDAGTERVVARLRYRVHFISYGSGSVVTGYDRAYLHGTVHEFTFGLFVFFL